ncbi:MAG: hypothetical protein KF784_20030, partial [Fimbriimonadaceae bacterium]|nr:hypothetical protein [Fimbriimonadaceae bacterium]
MRSSPATADTLLRQAGVRLCGMSAGGLSPGGFNVRLQVCHGPTQGRCVFRAGRPLRSPRSGHRRYRI